MARSKRSKIRSKHNITYKNPHPQSHAAYIIMRADYKKLDTEFENIITYLKMRWEHLNKVLNKEGDLVCQYCGKTHLDVGLDDLESQENNRINSQNKNLATIDHFFPVIDYPLYYLETRNWVVSCRKCNVKKGSSNPFKWLRKNKLRFYLSDLMEQMIKESTKLLHVRNHGIYGYISPDHIDHIENMRKIHNKAA